MVKYSPRWDMTTVPDDVLYAEVGRRNSAKRKTHGAGPGRPPTCPCGKCRKCKNRGRMREKREKEKG